MKTSYSIILFLLFVSCNNNKKDSKKIYLPESNGNLNNISVVIDNTLWKGKVGDKIRHIFAAPLNGLPVDEPVFKIRQIPPQIFDGFATRSRIVLKIEKGNIATTKILNEAFAKPQTVAVIGGTTNQELMDQLQEHKDRIIDAFNKEEIKEKQRRIGLSLLKDNTMENALRFSVDIPSAYRISKAKDGFFWLRKNLTNSKTIELMFYDIPFDKISKNDSTIVDIIAQRNHITKTQIPGEDGIYMAVEEAYAPALFETTVDNKPAFEVRGLWDMKGYTMAGPFVTYLIEDQANLRYLVADGYVYAPSLDKRDYMFELEAIIKSIKLHSSP